MQTQGLPKEAVHDARRKTLDPDLDTASGSAASAYGRTGRMLVLVVVFGMLCWTAALAAIFFD